MSDQGAIAEDNDGRVECQMRGGKLLGLQEFGRVEAGDLGGYGWSPAAQVLGGLLQMGLALACTQPLHLGH